MLLLGKTFSHSEFGECADGAKVFQTKGECFEQFKAAETFEIEGRHAYMTCNTKIMTHKTYWPSRPCKKEYTVNVQTSGW